VGRKKKQNPANVLSLKHFYYGKKILELFSDAIGAAVRVKHEKPREHCEN
jgi:hypothetical protein